MKMSSISILVGKYMAVLVLAVALLALFWPETGLWVKVEWVNYLLMIVMFGMGLTLRVKDFEVVFKHPRFLFIACITQFVSMPLIGYVLGKTFALEIGLLTGVVLVGCCPGGTASNVMTYLAKGDVALSVGMTAVNTILAPILTPALVYLFLNEEVAVDVWDMFVSILKVVVIPLAIGFVISHFFGKYTERAKDVMPLVSVVAIVLIVACVVSNNSQRILDASLVLFVVVILHNILGYVVGYSVGLAIKAPLAQRKAHTIEIGMQNSGLATTLAVGSFSAYPMAAVPGALFSVWHNISGAILANYFSGRTDDSEDPGSYSED